MHEGRGVLYHHHYGDVIMGVIASQITRLTIVYPTVYLDADQRKHQSSAWLAFVRGIHRGPVNSPHKWSVTRKMFPFDDVIMIPEITGKWCACVWRLGFSYPSANYMHGANMPLFMWPVEWFIPEISSIHVYECPQLAAHYIMDPNLFWNLRVIYAFYKLRTGQNSLHLTDIF